MIPDLAGHHQLVRARLLHKGSHLFADLFGCPHSGAGQSAVDHGLGRAVQPLVEALNRLWQLARLVEPQVDEGLLHRGKQGMRLGLVIGDEGVIARHNIGLGQMR